MSRGFEADRNMCESGELLGADGGRRLIIVSITLPPTVLCNTSITRVWIMSGSISRKELLPIYIFTENPVQQ